MLCMDCKEKPATVHLTQIINGEKVELHLCFHCANRRGIQMMVLPFAVQPFVKPSLQPSAPSGAENRVCERCGYSWRNFMASSFLGCPKCYVSFNDLLSQVILKNYGSVKHQGKIPAKGAGPLKIRREILGLRNQLEKAVQEENFEKAAQLRDQIRALEQQV